MHHITAVLKKAGGWNSRRASHSCHRFLRHIAGILLFTALLALGLLLVINARTFYRLLLSPLGIAKNSGFTRDEILLNYNCLIDYCSPFCHKELAFPSLASSSSALSHFAEVKKIFQAFYLVLSFAGGLGALLLVLLPLPERKEAIRLAGMLCLLLPAFLMALFFGIFRGNFHDIFTFMHHILFRNMDWLFNPATDPVILILPEQYFLCCGGLVLLFLLVAGGLLLCHGRPAKENSRE